MPLPPAFASKLLTHLVPDVLGVDQHTVQIEDDRGDHGSILCGCRHCQLGCAGPARPYLEADPVAFRSSGCDAWALTGAAAASSVASTIHRTRVSCARRIMAGICAALR